MRIAYTAEKIQHPSGCPVSEILENACQTGGLTLRHQYESDLPYHRSVGTWREVGSVLVIDEPALAAMQEKFTLVYADGVLMVANCFAISRDEVKFGYVLGPVQRMSSRRGIANRNPS